MPLVESNRAGFQQPDSTAQLVAGNSPARRRAVRVRAWPEQIMFCRVLVSKRVTYHAARAPCHWDIPHPG